MAGHRSLIRISPAIRDTLEGCSFSTSKRRWTTWMPTWRRCSIALGVFMKPWTPFADRSPQLPCWPSAATAKKPSTPDHSARRKEQSLADTVPAAGVSHFHWCSSYPSAGDRSDVRAWSDGRVPAGHYSGKTCSRHSQQRSSVRFNVAAGPCHLWLRPARLAAEK